MLAYIFRRALQSVVVLLVVGLVAFSMFRFVGDPVDNLLGQERTDADIERLREQLGLNDPFPVHGPSAVLHLARCPYQPE